MSKIAIVTDSNSGITQEEGRRLGVSVIPMPFFINEKMYLEGLTLSQDEFYQWLKSELKLRRSWKKRNLIPVFILPWKP